MINRVAVANTMTENYMEEAVYYCGKFIGHVSMTEDGEEVSYEVVSANADGTERDVNGFEHGVKVLVSLATKYALV